MRASKKKPNRPKTTDSRKNLRCKAINKTQRSGSSRTDRAESTTAWLWCPPQIVVAATAVAAHLSLCCFGFFVALRFLMWFFWFCASILMLKEDELGCKRGRFHSFNNSLTHSNSIREIGRRRKRIKRKERRSGKIEGSSVWLLNKLFWILFTFNFLLLELVQDV